MKKIVLLILLLFVLNGCATLKIGDGGIVNRFNQSRELARATKMLEAGDRDGAVKALADICDSGGVAGVTDEALFRLALLSIHPAVEREGNLPALQLLKRLKKEYPASSWTVQSGQLIELLAGFEELRRQNRSLKSLNQSLSSENSELKNSIEQLKRLELELEKTHR